MQSALERRDSILRALSRRREDRIENLAAEFGVSEKTIRRDIELLSCSAPISTKTGPGGGVSVMPGYYYGRQYLKKEQETLLRSLLPGLQPDQQRIMQDILDSYAMPTVTPGQ